MPRCGVIYQLVDPRNGNVRYVGQTIHPEIRKRSHKQIRSCFGSSKKYRWICELFELDLEPEFEIIEHSVPESALHVREQHWVKVRTNEGEELFNEPAGRIRREDLWSEDSRMDVAIQILEMKRRLQMLMDNHIPLGTSHPIMKLTKRALDSMSALYHGPLTD